ncbi:CaiB/BaiF CoA transferase family protein [Herbaspirillum sp. alder98]|uniref:CaiB/BaiF CoA transferase family protein n=1 Tax=Herbaspirillum sp. alder98 TaxID=2913096 RepID=UPI001CD8500B|nr:CoA transferase [Herbaspirillum sp. alder98]MCA1322857.1 CoA transferase [Herbaspirillum sp. alder98]
MVAQQLESIVRAHGSLSGVVVLDLTRVVAGPYCAMILADLGATVIKIEHPRDADLTREFPPFRQLGDKHVSGFFAQYNRNKLAVNLDLKSEEGKQVFLEMVAKAHIVMENFRPGTMDKLGLDYQTLKAANPAIVFAAVSGFGQSGPNRTRPAYDSTAQATGGLWSMNGLAEEPMRVGTVLGDLSAGLFAAVGALAALRQAERTGQGQMVDVSQQDAIVSLTENAVVTYTETGKVTTPSGNGHPFVKPYGRYRCKDGYVFFGAYTDKFWMEACKTFGDEEMAADPEVATMAQRFEQGVYERKVDPAVRRWCGKYTKAELEAMVGDRFPLSPIKGIDEVVADPHLRQRDMLVSVQYEEASFSVFGNPVKLSGGTFERGASAPSAGQHNEGVYSGWLGMDHTRYAELQRLGVI